jgi:DNA-binding SARP family transcriptional activator
VHVRLLGPLTVTTETGDGTPNGDIQRSAFALLALNAGTVVSADRLIEELWGDFAPANPTNSVQSHISQLRRLLGSELIVTRPPGYTLDLDPDAVDALLFERLVLAARAGPPQNLAESLREALALWRGPPLADVGDAPFVAVQSSRLEELRLAAIEDRIDADLAFGLHAALVVELQTLVSEHPLRERFHGQLMIALYRCGRQAEALRAYDGARKILAEELGLSPGPELQKLEGRILTQDPVLDSADGSAKHVPISNGVAIHPTRYPSAIAYGPDEPCLGRDGELARLRERSEHTHQGHQHAIFIVGEPGIGKTRLTAEFARLAANEGAVVLFGRCDEDVLSPFQPFVEAIGDLVGRLGDAQLAALVEAAGPHLANLVPGLAPRIGQPTSPRPEEPSMLWIVDGLAAVLAALAATAPLVFVLDDVHWADSTTVAGLRHVLRKNSTSASLILATYRATDLHDGPLVELLADLRSDRSCERVALHGLDDVAIAELLTDSIPDSDLRNRAASRLRLETAGNPLFIGELLRQFVDEFGAPTSERVLALGSGAVPEGISEAIARRLHRVSDSCRTTLRLAAILGVVFSTTVLRTFAAGSVDDVLAALDEAEDAGIVREEPESEPPSYVFAHTLVRRTLYDGMSRARRQELHAAAAEAIAATVGRDDKSLLPLASHYRLAGSAANAEHAADVLLEAAAFSSRGWAKAEAADLYAAALNVLPESADERRRFATRQRSVNLQAAWHARFDHQSIAAVTGAPPESGQDL